MAITGKAVKRAVVFVNLHKKNAKEAASLIKTELEDRGINAVIFSFDGKPQEPPSGEWDIAFSVGGDGTVLYAARCLAPQGTPILPVNLGSVGFIAGVDRENWLDVFSRWERGELPVSSRCMLEISVERDSRTVMKNISLNDAVISATGIAKLINLDVYLDAETGGTALGSYRCDGLIIATPTGSTAYSMAAGGPILYPEMEAVILNPICPFALSNRPFVLPSRQTLVIRVAEQQRSDVLLTVDGQDVFNLECTDKVYIRHAAKPALLVFAGSHSYYSALRTKLFWGGK